MREARVLDAEVATREARVLDAQAATREARVLDAERVRARVVPRRSQ
jgi:hypothetical protein